MQYTIHIHVSALKKNPRLLVLNVKKYKRGGYFPFFHFLLQYTYIIMCVHKKKFESYGFTGGENSRSLFQMYGKNT